MSQSRFPGRINYGALVECALRGVVREALLQAGKQGLPGRHHFYITFRTDHPEAELADSLRERYPSEMTIALQHEFWDLEVSEDRFAVTLSFNSLPHRLEIPFEAVSVFADPSVEFGLQFTAPEEVAEKAGEEREALVTELSSSVAEPEPEGGAEVVTLDRFRKK